MNTPTLNPKHVQQVQDERVKQDEQWGGPVHDDNHTPLEWVNFVADQLEKVGLEVLKRGPDYFNTPDYHNRLVKVAALAFAAMESHDRKAAGK